MRNFILPILTLLPLEFMGQDQIRTSEGNLTVIPVLHGSLILETNGLNIFVDPYGGGDLYQDYQPDLVLITDIHGDHYNPETLSELTLEAATIIAPAAVLELMDDGLSDITIALANGESTQWQDIKVSAIPMYNLPVTEDSRHVKGRGNGYLLQIADKQIYISGDTEDIPEMRNLQDIDVAFVCMNLPYTMDVDQAADAVLEFKPMVVYPFHYRGAGGKFSDVEKFKQLVEAANSQIEVRLRDWYKN